MGIPPGEQAKRHRRLADKVGNTNLGHRDPVLLTLIIYILMYTPDFLDLDHPEKVEQTQLAFASLLYRQVLVPHIC